MNPRVLPPYKTRKWRLVMTGCFDDSGKESEITNRFVCLAGYVAGDLNWTDFAQLWIHSLVKHNISCIHMKDLIPIQGEYKKLGWDVLKRNEVLTDFIDIIKDTDLIGVGVGVDANTWRTLPKELTREHGNAMEFCLQRVSRLIVDRLSKAAPRDLLSLIFDCDIEFASRRFNIFSWVREHNAVAAQYFASIAFANPLYYVGLQAADFVAWLTRKQLIQQTGGFESTQQFKELFELAPGYVPDYLSELWTAQALEDGVFKPWKEAGRDTLAT